MNRTSSAAYRSGIFITLVTALFYGVWPSASRAVYADGGNASFVFLTATFLRCLPMLGVCLFQRVPLFPTRDDLRQGVIGGVFQACSSFFAFAAVAFLPGPLAVVIMFSHTLMLLGFLIWRGEIKADTATVLATVAALIGLVFVLDLINNRTSGHLIGIGLAFVCAVAIASRLYVYGHQTKARHPAAVGAENFLVAFALSPLIILYQTPHAPATLAGYGWDLLGAATLAVATLGQFYAIKLIGSFRYSLFMKMEPLFATIFAALLIGEFLKIGQYIGIILVVGSLLLYQWFDHRRKTIDSTSP